MKTSKHQMRFPNTYYQKVGSTSCLCALLVWTLLVPSAYCKLQAVQTEGQAESEGITDDGYINLRVPSGEESESFDTVLVSLLDGTIKALKPDTGEPVWSFSSGEPLLSSWSVLADEGAGADSPVGYVFPGADGTLYTYRNTEGKGTVEKLPISVRELVDASPSLTPDGAVVVGTRRSTVFAIGSDGTILRTFSTHGTDWRGKEGEDLFIGKEDTAQLKGATVIGRTDYVLRSLDTVTGLERWNATYSEVVPLHTEALQAATAVGLTDDGLVRGPGADDAVLGYRAPASVAPGGADSSRVPKFVVGTDGVLRRMHQQGWEQWSVGFDAAPITAFASGAEESGLFEQVFPPPLGAGAGAVRGGLAPSVPVMVLQGSREGASGLYALPAHHLVRAAPDGQLGFVRGAKDPLQALAEDPLQGTIADMSTAVVLRDRRRFIPLDDLGAEACRDECDVVGIHFLSAHGKLPPWLPRVGSPMRDPLAAEMAPMLPQQQPAMLPSQLVDPSTIGADPYEYSHYPSEWGYKPVAVSFKPQLQLQPSEGERNDSQGAGGVLLPGPLAGGSWSQQARLLLGLWMLLVGTITFVLVGLYFVGWIGPSRQAPAQASAGGREERPSVEAGSGSERGSESSSQGGSPRKGPSSPRRGKGRRRALEALDPAPAPRRTTKAGASLVGRLEFGPGILGYGSAGTIVYEGVMDGRPVAVKRLLTQYQDLAQKEIAALIVSDSHPNIVRCFALEEDSNFVYLALERCAGTLSDLFPKDSPSAGGGAVETSRTSRPDPTIVTQLPPHEPLLGPDRRPTGFCLGLMRDIAAGVASLHDLGIVHRDLKPHNVLVTADLQPKISDMGLSKHLVRGQHSFNSTAAGSAGWQAPEQLLQGRQTNAVDLFSLGCIMHYCATDGVHPFGGLFERDGNIMKGRACLDRLKPQPEIEHCVAALLSFASELRPSAAAVLDHPLWWDADRRLQFLQEVSDKMELQDREELAGSKRLLEAFEYDAPVALNFPWDKHMARGLMENLGKYRKYNVNALRDLLRVFRNKSHHFLEMPADLQATLGPLPAGFVQYFTSRFPRLVIYCFHFLLLNCPEDAFFKKYFSSPASLEQWRKYALSRAPKGGWGKRLVKRSDSFSAPAPSAITADSSTSPPSAPSTSAAESTSASSSSASAARGRAPSSGGSTSAAAAAAAPPAAAAVPEPRAGEAGFERAAAPPAEKPAPAPTPDRPNTTRPQKVNYIPPPPPAGPDEYPQRPGEAICTYYVKTGICKFKQACKFHHPAEYAVTQYTSQGLPIRPDAEDCTFYLRTGGCKFGAGCKFNHPDIYTLLQDDNSE